MYLLSFFLALACLATPCLASPWLAVKLNLFKRPGSPEENCPANRRKVLMNLPRFAGRGHRS